MTSAAPSRGWFALILSVGLPQTKECPGCVGGCLCGPEIFREEKIQEENWEMGYMGVLSTWGPVPFP